MDKELEKQLKLLAEAVSELKELNATWRTILEKHEELISSAEQFLKGHTSSLEE
jgi:uncharacterized protein YdcH (DUF465 family)